MDINEIDFNKERYEVLKMFTNKLINKLNNKESTTFMLMGFNSPDLAEAYARSGVDAIVICAEHFSFNDESVAKMITAINYGGATPIVRTADLNHKRISRFMDAGAGGIMATMIEEVDEIKGVIDAVKFPPFGKRGYCNISRLTDFGNGLEEDKLMNWSNNNTFVIAVLESENAVSKLDEFLGIDGLDGIQLGPADLAVSLGNYNNISGNVEVAEICRDVNKKIKKSGKYYADFASNVEQVRSLKDDKCPMINLGYDTMMVQRLMGPIIDAMNKD